MAGRSQRVVSAAYGVGSAVFIPLLGPFAPPILILVFPLVFRRGSNVAVEDLLTGFGVAWLGVMLVGPPSVRGAQPDSWLPGIGLGVVPLVMALVLHGRRQTAQ